MNQTEDLLWNIYHLLTKKVGTYITIFFSLSKSRDDYYEQ